MLVVDKDVGSSDKLGQATLPVGVGFGGEWTGNTLRRSWKLSNPAHAADSAKQKATAGGQALATASKTRKMPPGYGVINMELAFIPEDRCRPPDAGLLTVTLVRGANLISADGNGLSDPFVEIKLGKAKQKSRVAPKTLDPVYGDAFHFEIFADSELADYELAVTVKDQDKMSMDDTLGTLHLTLGQLFEDEWRSRTVRKVWRLSDREGKVANEAVASRSRRKDIFGEARPHWDIGLVSIVHAANIDCNQA